MPFARSSGAKSEIDQKLKTKRQQIIEDERIRTLCDSLILFYDKLMENYVLAHHPNKDIEGVEDEIQLVDRKIVEQFAREYAATKPIGY